MLERVWKAVRAELFPASPAAREAARDRAAALAPVIWLVGRTGAGKTSVVAALTGDPHAVVGNGFAPCTRHAAFHDVPAEAPLLRFLDTRGLEEPGYDPAEDIAWCEGQAHLLLAVASIADPAQDAVLRLLRAVRDRHPDWPLVVAETWLHARYPAGQGHPLPYPFTGGAEDLANPAVPPALRQALAHQRGLFARLPGPPPRFVPVDLTQPGDGLDPPDYGLPALREAILAAAPQARAALVRAAAGAEAEAVRAAARPLVLAYAALAAGAGAVPVPLAGIGGLAGVVAMLLRALAARHGIAWTPALFGQFTAAVGGAALLSFAMGYGLRELVKLVPVAGSWIGGSLNAAAAFALTVAIGEAAGLWLARLRAGAAAEPEEVRRAFAEGLSRGFAARNDAGRAA